MSPRGIFERLTPPKNAASSILSPQARYIFPDDLVQPDYLQR